MKLALITDAWLPQVNGVVRTLGHTVRDLSSAGHEVTVISPADFRTIPCPTYPEIRLALFAGRAVRQRLTVLAPDAVHIATEGPLGLAARNWCIQRGWPFTTAYHTQFPEYLRARFPIPLSLGYAAVRWFHGGASRTLVTTRTMQLHLEARGFRNLALWGRGVDTELFRPRDKALLELPRPVFLYFGRLAVEKGVEDFLRLDLPGTKLVVGDGPAAGMLRTRYPEAHFAGLRHGEDLAAHIAASDVFVFPSRTDTFGLVLLEAMACGVPVAAYPVAGPVDVVVDGVTGVLHEDLRSAALAALQLSPDACRSHSMKHSWAAATSQFLASLVLRPGASTTAQAAAIECA